MSVTILSPGFLTTVQDEGRTAFRNIGVSQGGALDVHALRIANLIVGNESSAAGLEITLGVLRLRFDDLRVVAWSGGAFAVRLGDKSLSAGRAAIARPGDELVIERPEIGCRAWLAISGGIDVPEVLGSRSTDLRANFGGFEGRALQVGDVLLLGSHDSRARRLLAALEPTGVASWWAAAEWALPAARRPVLRVMRGNEWLHFDPENRTSLLREPYTVTPQADRMGVRLEGSPLHYVGAELVSEAVAPGTIQVPPSGQPIVLLPDCQTVGGYPKLAHVITVDLPIAAQLRPGDEVRFVMLRLADAHQLLMARERQLSLFRVGLAYRMR